MANTVSLNPGESEPAETKLETRNRTPFSDQYAIMIGSVQHMVHLLVSPPDSLWFEVAIERPQIVIGRSSRADISVPDPSLSRSHAELSFEGNSWSVKDLGSRNGTRVNGDLIDEDTFFAFPLRSLQPPVQLS